MHIPGQSTWIHFLGGKVLLRVLEASDKYDAACLGQCFNKSGDFAPEMLRIPCADRSPAGFGEQKRQHFLGYTAFEYAR